MYQTLLSLHSFIRWLVLVSLLFAIYRSYVGWFSQKRFSKVDNAVRHWTATIAHIQLSVGVILYIKSPVVQYFWHSLNSASDQLDLVFFALIHFLMMIVAVVILTIGSAKSKRKTTDHEKFKTMFLWFSIALVIIFVSIPWPFSPLESRPLFRSL